MTRIPAYLQASPMGNGQLVQFSRDRRYSKPGLLFLRRIPPYVGLNRDKTEPSKNLG